MANSGVTRRRRTDAEARARAQRAGAMRIQGATWSQIATACEYSSKSAAYTAVMRVFREMPEVDREAQRKVWDARLEALWGYAMRDVSEQRPGAVRAAVALAQRSAAMHGIDAPATVTPSAEYLEHYVHEMVALYRDTVGPAPAAIEADIFDVEVIEEHAARKPENGQG